MEQEALDRLEDHARTYKRGTIIQSEHESARDLFIVQSGWLHSYVLLSNGSRQILRLHFAGDVVGLSTLAFGHSSDSTVAVTDVTLCPFPKDRLAQLFEEHPRIAALLFSLSLAERVMLADRLASVGRTSARARVALLICELVARLRVTKGPELRQFQMPFTQEEIGDATGLTAVHVNRMMRALVDDGLIARHGNCIEILDEEGLASEVNFVNRYAELETSWLPAVR